MTDSNEITPLADRLRAFARDPEMSDDDLSICFDAADKITALMAQVDALCEVVTAGRWDVDADGYSLGETPEFAALPEHLRARCLR